MRNDNVVIGVLLAVGCAVAPSVNAQNVDALMKLQDQTILLRAQTEQAKAAAELKSAIGKTQPDEPLRRGAPVVAGVFGSGADVYAQLLYSDGSRIDARVGDAVPGNYRVTHVGVERVDLTRGGTTVRAGFSSLRPEPEMSDARQSDTGSAKSGADSSSDSKSTAVTGVPVTQ